MIYLVTLSSEGKLFADCTSQFPMNDLKKISDWAFQWKMSFNFGPSKQAQEVIVSRELKNMSHPPSVTFHHPNLKNI